MNAYNEAHNLAQALKESDEFKTYNELKTKLDAQPQLRDAVKDFMGKQFEVQMKQMQGQELSEEETAQLGQLYSIIMSDPLCAEYMQAEMRFSLMINDIFKIIGDACNLDMPGM